MGTGEDCSHGGEYWLGLLEKGLEFFALPSPSHETCGRGFIFPCSLAQPCRCSSRPPRADRLCKALQAACVPRRAQHQGCVLPVDTSQVQRATVFQPEGYPQMKSSHLEERNFTLTDEGAFVISAFTYGRKKVESLR